MNGFRHPVEVLLLLIMMRTMTPAVPWLHFTGIVMRDDFATRLCAYLTFIITFAFYFDLAEVKASSTRSERAVAVQVATWYSTSFAVAVSSFDHGRLSTAILFSIFTPASSELAASMKLMGASYDEVGEAFRNLGWITFTCYNGARG